MKKKTILALIMGGSMILTACGKSAAVSEAVENASIQQSIEDSGEQETAEAETSASSESKHSGKKSEHSSDKKTGMKSKEKTDESGDPSDSAVKSTLSDGDEVSGESYTATEADESAVDVSGDITASINDSTIQKISGDATSADDSSFKGVNAAVRVYGNATLNISGSKITADAQNATGVFAYDNGTIYISDSTVDVTGGGAGGIQVAGGGTLYAKNLTVTSASKAAIRSDRGGGILVVDGGTYTSTGSSGCPAIYSTAEITVKDADCISENSRAVIIEGKNSVTLNNCTLTGNDQSTKEGNIKANVLLYQSASGDADEGTSVFTMNGGSCTLNATDQELQGSITVDEISSLEINLINSAYEGSINENGEAGTVSVKLDDSSTWTLTADAYITEFDGNLENVTASGHHLYVNGEQVI